MTDPSRWLKAYGWRQRAACLGWREWLEAVWADAILAPSLALWVGEATLHIRQSSGAGFGGEAVWPSDMVTVFLPGFPCPSPNSNLRGLSDAAITVVHELAHVAAENRYPELDVDHGIEWISIYSQAVMEVFQPPRGCAIELAPGDRDGCAQDAASRALAAEAISGAGWWPSQLRRG